MKTYNTNKYIIIPMLILAYLIIIGGYIWVLIEIKNSYFPIFLCTVIGGMAFVGLTINLPVSFKGQVLVENNNIKAIYKNKTIKEIDLDKIKLIEYYHFPLIKRLEFIRINGEDNKQLILDFSIVNYLEIYKYVVEYCKNNSNTLIDEKLIKRVENVKMNL